MDHEGNGTTEIACRESQTQNSRFPAYNRHTYVHSFALWTTYNTYAQGTRNSHYLAIEDSFVHSTNERDDRVQNFSDEEQPENESSTQPHVAKETKRHRPYIRHSHKHGEEESLALPNVHCDELSTSLRLFAQTRTVQCLHFTTFNVLRRARATHTNVVYCFVNKVSQELLSKNVSRSLHNYT